MGLFDALNVSATGLTAERTRMDVTAENLANAQSTGGYRRKDVVLRQAGDGFAGALSSALGSARAGAGAPPRGVEVAAVVEDELPNRRIYDPGHPDADARGYVELPNVNPATEMVDLIAASRAYEANVTALQTAKAMFTKTLELLR
jgi:flagellar basal-body rod protein FlgC